MAISANTVWEIRTTGADTNGGGFVAGSGGTDYSQQTSAQVAVADAVANGTTTLTSATASFTSAMVGSIIYLTGGSGSLAAVRRQVVTYTNATTVVLDATVATGTGITLNLGGCLLSLVELGSARGMVTSNKAFVQAGSYSQTATATFAAAGSQGANTIPLSRLIGYSTVRGDGGQPTITLATNTGLTAISLTNGGWEIENFAINCATLGTSKGVAMGGWQSILRNVKVSNATTAGIQVDGGGTIEACELTGCAGTGAIFASNNLSQYSTYITNCWIHGNTCPGVRAASAAGACLVGNLVTNNTGSTSDGIQLASTGPITVANNTVYGSGRDGIQHSGSPRAIAILGNIFANNGGYGLNFSAGAGWPASPVIDGNAYYSNTSGNRNNVDDTTVNPVNGVSPYANVFDITAATTPALTVSPFTSAGTGDFTLNNTAGGGASLRANAPGNSFPGSTPVGYRDFGAIQHQDSPANVFWMGD